MGCLFFTYMVSARKVGVVRMAAIVTVVSVVTDFFAVKTAHIRAGTALPFRTHSIWLNKRCCWISDRDI